jgi:signal transduction histidine kinase
MFERFFRAKNATNIQGTGLGLNIVSKYLEAMGGSIRFKSELNAGTTFTITIPNKK